MAVNDQIKTLQDFAIPVHRSIIKRDLYMGVPLLPLMIVLLLTVVMIFSFRQFAFIAISIILIIILREVTKKDEYLLDILIMHLLDPDELR